jgi:hypothetical protein
VIQNEAAWMGDMPATVETEEEVLDLLNQWKVRVAPDGSQFHCLVRSQV